MAYSNIKAVEPHTTQTPPPSGASASSPPSAHEIDGSHFAWRPCLSKEERNAYTEPSKAMAESVLRLWPKLGARGLPTQSKLATARQEVHATGTSQVKVTRNRANRWPTKKCQKKEDKEERRAEIARRREESSRRKSAMAGILNYEGLMNGVHDVKVELPDIKEFTDTISKIVENVKQAMNSHKKVLEVVFTHEAGDTVKVVLAIAAILALTVFSAYFVTSGAYLSFCITACCAAGMIWWQYKSIFEFALQNAFESVGGTADIINMKSFDPADLKEAEMNLAELERAVEQIVNEGGDMDSEDAFAQMDKEWFGYEAGIGAGARGVLLVLADIVSGLLGCVTGVFGLGEKRTLLRDMAQAPRTIDGLKTLVSMVLRFIAGLVDSLLGTSLKDLFPSNTRVTKWYNDVIQVVEDRANGILEVNAESAHRVHSLVDSGLRIVAEESKLSAEFANLHRIGMNQLRELQTVYNKHGLGAEARPVPLCIMIRGASGVGKSNATKAFLGLLAQQVLPKEKFAEYKKCSGDHTWSYTVEEDHANGYNGQWCVVMDDFGQHKTAPGAKTEALALIRFININPAKLNMAELHLKGRTNFISRVVLCTTNKFTFWDMNIVEPEAMLRRVHVWADFYPKREYSTDDTMNKPVGERRLDVNKTDGSGYDTNAGVYCLMKLVDAKQQKFEVVKEMDLAEFVKHCAALYRKNEAEFGNFTEKVNQLIEDAENKRGLLYEGGTMSKACTKAGRADMKEKVCASVRENARIAARKMRQMAAAAVAKTKQWWQLFTGGAVQKVMRVIAMVLGVLGVIALFVLAATAWFKRRAKPKPKQQFTDWNEFVHAAYVNELGKRDPTKAVPLGTFAMGMYNTYVREGRKGHMVAHGCEWTRREDEPNLQYLAGYFDPEDKRPTIYGEMYASAVMSRNVYHIYAKEEHIDVRDSAGKLTMLKGRIGMTNAHYVQSFRNLLENEGTSDGHFWLVKHGNKSVRVRVPLDVIFDDTKTLVDVEKDIMLIEFGKYMPVCWDITKKFVSQEDMVKNRDFDMTLYAPRSPSTLMMMPVMTRIVDKPLLGDDAVHSDLLWYNAPTVRGDCGSLLFLNSSSSMERRIAGFHMGGTEETSGPKKGYAAIAQAQYLEGMLSNFDQQLSLQYKEEPVLRKMGHEDSLEVVEEFPKASFLPTQSALIKSPLNGIFGPETRIPAKLKPFAYDNRTIKPLVVAMKSQAETMHTVNPDDLELAVKGLVHDIQTSTPLPNAGNLLSIDEAIEGSQNMPHFRGIPRNTSAGATGLLHPEIGPGKKGAFGADGAYTLNTPVAMKVKSLANKEMDEAMSGLVPSTPYVDILKDEKRPINKVLSGKTRMIRAAPLTSVINIRRLFGGLSNDLIAGRINNGICVGINPYSSEWTQLKKSLQQVGEHVVAGDFSGFDNSQSCQLIQATVEVMKRLTGFKDPDVLRAIDAYAVTLSQPRHLLGGEVYEKFHGLPSGNPMTSIMNSIFGLLVFRLLWLRLTQHRFKTKAECMAAYSKYVVTRIYGDDNVHNIHGKFIDDFNQHTLMAVAPEFSVKYTSEDKDDLNPPKSRTIREVTFLKRAFRFEPAVNREVAPLEFDTVIEMAYYTKKGGSALAITEDNCYNTLQELCLHGPAMYDTYGDILVEEAKKRAGLFINKQSWKQQLRDLTHFVPPWMEEWW